MSEQASKLLSDAESLVLGRLFYRTHPYGEMCTDFATLSAYTDMSRADVRTTCRMLRDKGLAEYHSGLMTENGSSVALGTAYRAVAAN